MPSQAINRSLGAAPTAASPSATSVQTAGTVTVDGRPYARQRAPLHEVGALLEARAVHTGRSATNHLLAMAATAGIGRRRVEEVIELVGLRDVAGKRAGTFSLGMGQRLGIASALLGDPATLILDEPVNGLDPDGILWVRTLLKELAGQGRTVFLSSHLMSEMEMTADHLIVVGRGRLLRDMSLAEFIADAGGMSVRVRSPQTTELRETLLGPDVTVTSPGPGELTVRGLASEEVGRRAAAAGLTLYELTPVRSSLEAAYMEITKESVDYHGGSASSTDGIAA